MEQVREITKDMSMVFGIVGGMEKFIEIIVAAYHHEKQAHQRTKEELLKEQAEHQKTKEELEKVKLISPSLDSNKDVLV